MMPTEQFIIDRKKMHDFTLTVTVAKTARFWLRVGLFFIKLGARIAGFSYRQEQTDERQDCD